MNQAVATASTTKPGHNPVVRASMRCSSPALSACAGAARAASSAGTGSNGGGAASTSVTFLSSGAQITDSNLQLWIGNPFASDETTFNFQGSWRQSTPLSIGVYGGGFVNNTTSYDGFSLIPSAGTITGTVRIYGVRN